MYMYMLCVLSCAYSQLGMANTLSKDHWLVHWPLTSFSVLYGTVHIFSKDLLPQVLNVHVFQVSAHTAALCTHG